ncbi:TonB-dependent receptor [Delftia sp. PS-11]|uniref:TonB-dependent receptor n=1 Tax=Delftia sp. PS-11 TaxID=2767222 RepID=UPI002458B1C3|nr:TonB-dependent receptor [Delftia sp. PS-11]
MSRHQTHHRSTPVPPRFVLRPTVLAVHLAMVGWVVIGAGWAGLSHAQQAAPMPQGQTATATSLRHYDIPAGPLNTVLVRFLSESGVLLSGSTELARGKSSPGVTGRFAPGGALAALLADTGLEAVADARGRYTLRTAPAANAPLATVSAPTAGVAVLAEVEVTTQAQRADGLPAAYADGQFARGGRLGLLGNKDFMETPFSTISYTEQAVRDRQASDIGEVIAATDPSIYLPQRRNYIDSFYIRGFNTNAIDTTFNGLAGLAPFLRGSTEIAERIEVLKGPSAMLNGMLPQGSIGGAINIVPKRAGDTPLARTTASYESDSLWGAHIDAGRRFGEDRQWGVRFNGAHRNGDTAIDNQSQRSQLAALALDWRSATARLALDIYHQEGRMRGLNYYGIANIAPQVTTVPAPRDGSASLVPPWSFGSDRTDTAMLRGEIDLGAVTLYAAAGWQGMNYSMLVNNSSLLSDTGTIASGIVRLDTDYSTRSGEVGMRGGFELGGTRHEWSIAATGYRRNGDFELARAAAPMTSLYQPNFGHPPAFSGFGGGTRVQQKARLRSVALADTVSFFGDRLQVTAGVRHQQVINAAYDESAVSPSAGVLFKASDQVSVYANTIQGLSQGGTAPATAANAGAMLKPHKSQQSEVGLKYDMGRFAWTASLFRITRPSTYTDASSNVFGAYGRQRNTGAEFGFFGEFRDGLRLSGGVAYTRATLVNQASTSFEGRQATGVPRLIARVAAELDLAAVPGLTLTAGANHTGSQYATHDNRLKLGAYTVVDLGVRYQMRLAARPIILRSSIHNVFNKAYWIGSWSGSSDSGLSGGLGAPRTLMVSAQVDF